MVYVFFAEGFEEIEALTVVDLLRRAQLDVRMTGIAGAGDVTGAHGIRVGMEGSLEDVNLSEAQMLVLPGGMPGTKNLGECKELTELLQEANEKKTGISAICAAPGVLGDLGILQGKRAVCYPGYEERLSGAVVEMESVVTDGHVITSRGAGTAISFGLEIVSRLKGQAEAERIRESIIYEEKRGE